MTRFRMRIAGRLAYYILSLSAFTDPLTGEPLTISATDREALNNPRFGNAGPGAGVWSAANLSGGGG